MQLIIIMLVILLTNRVAYSTEIKIVTEHYPPFQIVENGQVVGGLAVDIVNDLLSKVNLETNIVAYPWPRAYKMALEEKNVLIFSITRTEERESKFKWVGSIIGVNDYLWRLKSNESVNVRSLDEAKKYTMAVPKDDQQHHFIRKNGFSNVYVTSNFDSALKMLYANHVDLVMGPESSIYYRLKELSLDYSALEKAYDLGQKWGELSIAFSVNTSDEVVKKFQDVFQEMKNDGTCDKLILKWVPNT